MYFVSSQPFFPQLLLHIVLLEKKLRKASSLSLATPTTDGELLLGKSLAAFIPCLGVTYIAAAISATILDVWSITKVGYFLVPDLFWFLANPCPHTIGMLNEC